MLMCESDSKGLSGVLLSIIFIFLSFHEFIFGIFSFLNFSFILAPFTFG